MGEFYHETARSEFGDWQIDVPRIHTLSMSTAGWTGQRCSSSFSTTLPAVYKAPTYYYGYQYSGGVTLSAPGHGSQKILESVRGAQWPSGTTHVTADNWRLTCLSNASDGGQGFWATAPNGDRYKFDRYIKRRGGNMGTLDFGNAYIRDVNILAATEVKDVHGNTVAYDYDGAGRLTTIRANDGRRIDIRYSGSSKLISSVVANPGSADERTWTYSYGTETYNLVYSEGRHRSSLQSVKLPDNTSWTYHLGGMNAEPSPYRICPQYGQTLTVKHPQGITGTFGIGEVSLRQSETHMSELADNCRGDVEPAPPGAPKTYRTTKFKTMAVWKKTLSGSGYPSSEWTFQRTSMDSAGSSSPIHMTNRTIMTDPTGTKTYYYHRWNGETLGETLGGKLVRQEVYAPGASSPLSTTDKTYEEESSTIGGYPASYPYNRSERIPTHLRETKTTRGSRTFATKNTYEKSRASSADLRPVWSLT